MTRWLSEDELRAWLKLAGVMLKLAPALDSQLQRDSDLNHFDYLCLAMLSETENRTLTMSALAGSTNASLSRLSHVVTKLERRGWVSRMPSPASKRVTLVTLTDDGWDVLVKAAQAPSTSSAVTTRTAFVVRVPLIATTSGPSASSARRRRQVRRSPRRGAAQQVESSRDASMRSTTWPAMRSSAATSSAASPSKTSERTVSTWPGAALTSTS